MISCIKMQEKMYLGNKFYDPHISRIHKIMSKICPKFLDLYASINGTLCRSLRQKNFFRTSRFYKYISRQKRRKIKPTEEQKGWTGHRPWEIGQTWLWAELEKIARFKRLETPAFTFKMT
jgi:hypothetical protein